MVQQLGDPSIVPVFLGLKSGNDDEPSIEALIQGTPEKKPKKSNPIVIVVEDADACLVKRNGENMSSISAILNLTDGILGDMLDIRIIATTNAKRNEMDEALLRDGRMSYHLDVGRLSVDEANSIYCRLMDKTDVSYPTSEEEAEKGVLLASVYKLAKEHGFRHEKNPKPRSNVKAPKNKRPIGFSA
jgi:SpoVK/Ycf46/Vps4 family AAA+-type ATPase